MKNARLIIEIKSPDSRLIIGKNGQTLEALEHILNLIINRGKDNRSKIALDIDGYRQQQINRLQDRARKAAEQVKSTGKEYRFEPMLAKERRTFTSRWRRTPLFKRSP